MAGNNQIQFLRGKKENVSNALEELLPGQPLYSKDENYLYIGRDENGAVAPVTTDRIKKGTTYVKIVEKAESDGSTTKYMHASDNCIVGGSIEAGDGIITLGSVYARKNLGALGPNIDNKRHAIYTNGITTSDGKYSSDPSLVVGISDNNANLDSAIQYGHDSILPINNSNTASIGNMNNPFGKAFISTANIQSISNINTITCPAGTDNNANSIFIGPSADGSYIGAYLQLGSAPNTQIPTIGLRGNILPDTSGGTSGAKYNIGSKEYKFNEIHAVTIDEINSRLDALGFKSGNLIDANTDVVVGKVARLGKKVLYGTIYADIGVTGGLSIMATNNVIPDGWISSSTPTGKLPLKLTGSRGGELTVYMTINGKGNEWRINIPAISNPTELYYTADETRWVDWDAAFNPYF